MKRKIILSFVLCVAIILLCGYSKVNAAGTMILGNQVIDVPDAGDSTNISAFGGTVDIENKGSDVYTVTLDNVNVTEGTEITPGDGDYTGLVFLDSTSRVDLVIKGNVTLGTKSNCLAYGMMVNGDLTIKGFDSNAKLNLNGDLAVMGNNVQISDLKLDAYSDSKNVMDYNMYAMGDMVIKNSTVKSVSQNDAGIFADGKVEIDNSTVSVIVKDNATFGSIVGTTDITFKNDVGVAIAKRNGITITLPEVKGLNKNGQNVYVIVDDSNNSATSVEIKAKKITVRKEDGTEFKFNTLVEALGYTDPKDVVEIAEEESSLTGDLLVENNVKIVVKNGCKLNVENLEVNGEVVLENNAELVANEVTGNGDVKVEGKDTSLIVKSIVKEVTVMASNGYKPVAGDVVVKVNVTDETADEAKDLADALKANLTLSGFGDFNTKVEETDGGYDIKLEAKETAKPNGDKTETDDNTVTNPENKDENIDENGNVIDNGKKDNTPKTGNEVNYAIASLSVIVLASAGIVFVKKYNT